MYSLFFSAVLQQVRCPEIIRVHCGILDVNDSLTSLSPHPGFQNFVCAKASELCITGNIHVSQKLKAEINFEGTPDQVEQFKTWLKELHSQGMFSDFSHYNPEDSDFKRWPDFFVW